MVHRIIGKDSFPVRYDTGFSTSHLFFHYSIIMGYADHNKFR